MGSIQNKSVHIMHTFGLPVPMGIYQKTSYVTKLTKHKFVLQFFRSFKWDMNILFPNLHNYPGAHVVMCQYNDSFP